MTFRNSQAAALAILDSPFDDQVATIVTGSRMLSAADDGNVLQINADATLTIPTGLGQNFSCIFHLVGGTLTLATSGGTQINGSVSSITRAAASNVLVALIARLNLADSYSVNGT